jgi:glycosyltransferase involved in cell wall biosynthesis
MNADPVATRATAQGRRMPTGGGAKVLVLMPLAEQRGGHELMLLELLRNSRAGSIQWQVVFFEDGPLVAETRALGFGARVIEAGRLRHVGRFGRTALAVARLAREFDVVLSWMPKAHLYGGTASLLARRPALWYQAGTPSARAWLDRLATAVPARGVLTVSRSSDHAQRALRPSRRTRLVYPAVDLSRFDPERVADRRTARELLGLGEGGPLLGVAARLQRWKGIHVLVQALPSLERSFSGVRLVVVGGEHSLEPGYQRELRQLAQRLGVEKRVVLAGFQRDVPCWLSALDVVVHPAFDEPFGIAVVEAMALGKPVVASDSGGPLEIIDDGVSGVLFRTGDPDALATAVEHVLRNPKEAMRLGTRAKERARDFSVQRFADEVASAVLELAS